MPSLSGIFPRLTMRRYLLLSSIAMTAALAFPLAATAQPKTGPGITIVVPINATGSSRDASVKAMKAVVEVVRQQPGLIDEVLMENKNPDNKPSHVHVMRWREQKNWEAVFQSPEFQKILKDTRAVLTLSEGASIYTPVK